MDNRIKMVANVLILLLTMLQCIKTGIYITSAIRLHSASLIVVFYGKISILSPIFQLEMVREGH